MNDIYVRVNLDCKPCGGTGVKTVHIQTADGEVEPSAEMCDCAFEYLHAGDNITWSEEE